MNKINLQVARMCKYMKDPTPINLDVRHYERLLAASTNGRRKYLMRLQTMEIGEAAEKVKNYSETIGTVDEYYIRLPFLCTERSSRTKGLLRSAQIQLIDGRKRICFVENSTAAKFSESMDDEMATSTYGPIYLF